jgi:hypothetical protein
MPDRTRRDPGLGLKSGRPAIGVVARCLVAGHVCLGRHSVHCHYTVTVVAHDKDDSNGQAKPLLDFLFEMYR